MAALIVIFEAVAFYLLYRYHILMWFLLFCIFVMMMIAGLPAHDLSDPRGQKAEHGLRAYYRQTPAP